MIPELLERDLLVQPEPELLHHAPRLHVLLGADADEPLSTEDREAVLERGGPAFGRQAAADVRGIDQPADLRVAGPRAMVREADPAHELTRREQLRSPDAEAVLVPVPAGTVERGGGLLWRHRSAAHVPHHDRIGAPARQRRQILVAPEAKPQPSGLDVHYSPCLRKTTQALCPPKPNEFETPMVISDFRDSFGM